MKSTTKVEVAEEVFNEYAQWRLKAIKERIVKAEGPTATAETLKSSPVVFLTPVGSFSGTQGGIGEDEFKKVLGLLGTEYKPINNQTFFSFTNTHGSHWALVKYEFTSNEWKKIIIPCKGDGACGVHAMVNAVINKTALKDHLAIKKAAVKVGLDLRNQSTHLKKAIDFVINIIGNGPDQQNTVAKLKKLKDTGGQIVNHWVDRSDMEVFAKALVGLTNITYLDPAFLQDDKQRIFDLKKSIKENLNGLSEGNIEKNCIEEKELIDQFCKENKYAPDQKAKIIKYANDSKVANPVDLYLQGLESTLKTGVSTEKTGASTELTERDLPELLKKRWTDVDQESWAFVDNQENEPKLRLLMAKVLINKDEDPDIQKASENSIKSYQEHRKLGKQFEANHRVSTQISEWIEVISTSLDESTKTIIIASLSEQNKKHIPTAAYNGVGLKANKTEIDGQTVLEIKEIFSPEKERFYDGDDPTVKIDKNAAQLLNGQYITAVIIGGKQKSIADLTKEDPKMGNIANIFHSQQDVKFVVCDKNGSNKQTIGCEAKENSIFVTEKCNEKVKKILIKDGVSGAAYNPEIHGLEVLGLGRNAERPGKSPKPLNSKNLNPHVVQI